MIAFDVEILLNKNNDKYTASLYLVKKNWHQRIAMFIFPYNIFLSKLVSWHNIQLTLLNVRLCGSHLCALLDIGSSLCTLGIVMTGLRNIPNKHSTYGQKLCLCGHCELRPFIPKHYCTVSEVPQLAAAVAEPYTFWQGENDCVSFTRHY